MARYAPQTPRSRVLGIDPAREGAAVLRGPSGALEALCVWHGFQRNLRPRVRIEVARPGADGGRPTVDAHEVPSRPGSVGAAIARVLGLDATTEIASEDVYLGKNPASSLQLAKWNGGLVAGIEEAVGIEAVWVKPDEWRALVLGVKRATQRDVVKAASLRYMPARIPSIVPLVEALGHGWEDHTTDAAGVSEWARCRR